MYLKDKCHYVTYGGMTGKIKYSAFCWRTTETISRTPGGLWTLLWEPLYYDTFFFFKWPQAFVFCIKQQHTRRYHTTYTPIQIDICCLYIRMLPKTIRVYIHYLIPLYTIYANTFVVCYPISAYVLSDTRCICDPITLYTNIYAHTNFGVYVVQYWLLWKANICRSYQLTDILVTSCSNWFPCSLAASMEYNI